MAGCLLVENRYVSLVLLLFEYFFAEMWFGPAVAIVQEITPTYMRSLATAIYITSGGIGAFSPLIVGWMNDHLGSPVASSLEDEDPDPDTGNDPTVPLLIMVAGLAQTDRKTEKGKERKVTVRTKRDVFGVGCGLYDHGTVDASFLQATDASIAKTRRIKRCTGESDEEEKIAIAKRKKRKKRSSDRRKI